MASLTALATAEPAAANKAEVAIVIEGNDQMQFNVKAFEAVEGQTVRLTFKNVGKLPVEAMGHNVVILKAGEDKFAFAGKCITPEAIKSGYLPTEQADKDKILTHTKILGPGETDTITFTAPAAGEYQYLCSFPGHVGVMNGVMTVKAK
ncbi:MAG: plastocyanin/azurin family copper-binding protein [Luteolibacter sp.]